MQEITVVRGSTLDLVRPDPETSCLCMLLCVDAFGTIRLLA
jgi:splicing factor 3B subunit 3